MAVPSVQYRLLERCRGWDFSSAMRMFAYLHLPTDDRACSWQMACVVLADSMRLTPAATAADASALQMLLWPM